MSENRYKWRTRNASYVYVDSATGSDTFGDGTMQNPYQSLGKAWRGHTTYHPDTIVCRGTFSEDMCDGAHSTTIRGDYYGAATFDGAGAYTLYGFTTPSMVFVNCACGTYDSGISAGSPSLAGVGRALNAKNHLGSAEAVCGVKASSVLLRASALYWGAIGGGAECSQVGVVSPKPNPNHLFWWATAAGGVVRNFSVYDVPREYRNMTQRQYNARGGFKASIFGKAAFLLDDAATFTECSFCNDCEWWNGDEQFVPQGDTPEERMASLQEWIAGTACSGRKIVLTDCRLLSKSSDEVWNNPAGGDLTLRWENCDEELLDPAGNWRGAFPPCINIPILSDSAGRPNTWDERTASGLISVAADRIVVDDVQGENEGEILSKVIVTNPDDVSISGIFAGYVGQAQETGILLGKDRAGGAVYGAGETLPPGRYRCNGDIVYRGEYLTLHDILVVSGEGTAFEAAVESQEPTVTAVTDCNIIDNMWLRSNANAPLYIRATDGLQQGGHYVNVFDKAISYRGRTIAPGESFQAENSEDTYSCPGDPDYRVAVVFDDTRTASHPWVPAQMWGEYFAGKLGSAFRRDEDGEILGSGNVNSFVPKSEGGESESVCKTTAHARFIQLRIKAVRIWHG